MATFASRLIAISTEEIENLQRANENSPGSREIKLRRNEIKLRKNEMKLRKNFSFPRWIFRNPYRGIERFP